MKKSHLIASAVATGLFCSAVSHAGGLVGGFGGGLGGTLNGGLGSNIGNMGSMGGMGSLGGSMNGGGAFNAGSDSVGGLNRAVSRGTHSAEKDTGKAASATGG
ncbi:MAG: hypothetical protein JWO52_1569, partial [Gammaproteobacteria bacterium]|nr:hypothetical protein [Gammaproteobacteria bacterium]